MEIAKKLTKNFYSVNNIIICDKLLEDIVNYHHIDYKENSNKLF